jgi:hypothetical protein
MSIVINDLVLRQDIIDRFNLRVRDWVVANTNWTSTTPVWNTTVGNVVSKSTTGRTSVGGNFPGTVAGGSYDRTAFTTPTPSSILETDFSAAIGAGPLTTGHVVKVLKDFMTLFANNHKIQLMNTGNLSTTGARTSFGTIPYVGTVRLSDVLTTVKTNVQTDVDNAAINRNVESGFIINASGLLNLIEDCRTIWTNRCLDVVSEEFRYSYCHSSCHSNHGSHGSRGRR